MSDDMTVGNSALSSINGTQGTQSTTRQKKNGEIGKEEFLTMLVAQLKAQDPLDPMKNEDFAVNLAQFSQLEQLIAINNKLTSDSSETDATSMASYLGHEVVFDSTSVTVKNSEAGSVAFELGKDARSVTVELLGSDGKPAARVELGEMKAGQQMVELKNLGAPNGEYKLRVNAVDTNGMAFQPEAYAAGVVSGFVPGPEPVLLVDGREVSPGDIKEVRMAAESV